MFDKCLTLWSWRWLYALFLAINANFRLKRKKVSSDKADPDLNQGCAYFVKEREYKQYLANYKDETEPVCPTSVLNVMYSQLSHLTEVYLLSTRRCQPVFQ
jgi:hypothetical protein